VRESQRFAAVLLDRDGTLLEDVPYNGDPASVRPVPGAKAALDRLRAAGLRLGVVTNQSGVARGLISQAAVDRVNARVAQLLGPFDTWQVCPHDDTAHCACRKPRPGLVLAAARALDVHPRQAVVVGDIGADVAAGLAAGTAAVLVPTPVTRPSEVHDARVVVRDLAAAVDWILAQRTRRDSGPRVLAVRSDAAGDVLVTGPAVRALADSAGWFTLLCGPHGRAAAKLLPGVDELAEWCVPWIDPRPNPVAADDVGSFVKQIQAGQHDDAVIFTSYHQSPLPLAWLLKLAGAPRVAAISVDYPGALLDLRHRVDESLPEPERALSLAAAAGYALPAWDDGRLRLRPESVDLAARPDVAGLLPPEDFVVVHPGASVPARACPPERCRDIVAALAGSGRRVLVTGGPDERALTSYVAGRAGVDVGGRTDLADLAALVAHARAFVVGNTGPHVAAAVGTPVVSLFAPTVPYRRWGTYQVPAVRLGDPDAPCRDSRATVCPVPGHPCLSDVDAHAVVAAVEQLEAVCAS
jgi:histidinol-phosphate phosphatase family protein